MTMGIMRHFLEETGKIAVDGGDISYRYYVPVTPDAAAKTPMIIVHGGPGGCGMTMYDYLHPLADDRPVLFYDQLGSYYSPANLTTDQMRIERFADEIQHIMAARKWDKVYLLGQSWGSAVTTQFTLTHPDKVAGIILSGPHLSTARWIADCNRLLTAMPQDMQDTIRTSEANGTTDSAAYQAADLYFSKRHLIRMEPWPPNRDFHRNKHNSQIYNAMWGPSEFSCAGLLHDMDLFPRLHEIAVPALLICGEYDTGTPESTGAAANLMQNATLTVIPDSGHVSFADHQEDYIAAVRAYFVRQGA